MNLTDNEKRDLIKLIESGKPLPDRYRFLLFDDKREVELVWNGKTNEVCNIVLPFQVIEQVDEPRAEKPADAERQADIFSTDARGRQLGGWSNQLIWGDNKLILSSLKNGPMREAIEAQGGLKLIYIDPPFDVGADFSMDIEIPCTPPPPILTDMSSNSTSDTGRQQGATFTKKANIMEEIAYRDTWGKGADSFIAMIYERLSLMRDLLAEDGSIYVHCDWRVNSYIRLAMDEVFGKSNFVNEVVWQYEGPQSPSPLKFGSKHDTIFRYAKNVNQNVGSDLYFFEKEEFNEKKYKTDENGRYFYTIPKGDYTQQSIERMDAEGKIYWTGSGVARIKKFIDISSDGKLMLKRKKIPDVWAITSLGLAAGSAENCSYPTQKPEALINRIIKASSNEGDIVADFFCGSGTTAAAAEKLGRKWIASDLGKFAIHTTRKRMIGVQRLRKTAGKTYRAFEILNLGKYERQHYIGVNLGLRLEQQEEQIAAKSKEYQDLILTAYAAQPTEHSAVFHGKKDGRMVAIGPINLPVTRLFVEQVIYECRDKRITRADILAFEFEMGLFPQIMDEAKRKGIELAPKYIPAEVFDKRAVEKNEVVFHDVSFIEAKPHITSNIKSPPDKGGKGGFIPYNRSLLSKAQANRKNPTPAETKLWREVLRDKQLDGLKFTRQKPLDNYIVDFYCAELMLVIEIDGDSHTEKPEYDVARTNSLNKFGVEVLRYTNAEVMKNLAGVYEGLCDAISQRKRKFKPPQSPLSGGGLVAVELTDFSVHYSQDKVNAEQSIKNGKSKIVADDGQLVRISKDKDGKTSRETLTKHWADWIDYWAVDFDFESKKETIRVHNEDTGETDEQWSGDYIFENEWQSFRTKKDRTLELTSTAHECTPGPRKIAVKVVDIFGNDTMKILEVNV